MPLSLGLRDEENVRINNILNKLMELVYVPEGWLSDDVDTLLAKLGLSAESINEMSNDELNLHLQKMHFDFANMEQFADALAKNKDFWDKAVSIYNFVQQESKVFSFEIFNKINTLK